MSSSVFELVEVILKESRQLEEKTLISLIVGFLEREFSSGGNRVSKIFVQIESDDMDRFLANQEEIAETLSRLLSIAEELIDAANDQA